MNVKIYTTPSCIWCAREKAFFKQHQIPYQEVDVSQDEKAAEEMIERSGQMGVPVTDIDGTLIVGFDESALRKALKMK